MSQPPPPKKRKAPPNGKKRRKGAKAKKKPLWPKVLGIGVGSLAVVLGGLWAVSAPPVPEPAEKSWPVTQARAVPAKENAFVTYQKAAESLDFGAPKDSKVAKDLRLALGKALDENGPLAPDVAGLLARNQKALAAFDVAARQPRFQVMPPGHDSDTPLPDMVMLQSLARLGALDFRERWRRGDYAGAADRAVEVLTLGRRMTASRHETLLVTLVGVVISEAQLDQLKREAALAKVPTPEITRLLGELNRIDGYDAPVEHIVLAERDLQLRLATRLKEKGLPETHADYNWAVNFIHGRLDLHTRNLYDGMATKVAQRDFKGAEAMLDRLEPQYPMFLLSGLFHPGDTVSSILLSVAAPGMASGPGKVLATEARFDAMRVRLASELHRRRHQAPAENLEALVPTYMAKVPADPFQPTQPLGYAKGRLWSVGWDQVDQQGRLAVDPKARRKGKGDLVLIP